MDERICLDAALVCNPSMARDWCIEKASADDKKSAAAERRRNREVVRIMVLVVDSCGAFGWSYVWIYDGVRRIEKRLCCL